MATKTLDTIDVIKGIVNTMTPTVVIQKATDNLDDTYTLDIFDTFWLRRLNKINIDSKTYRIISFIINVSITIQDITEGAGVPTVDSFTMPKPHLIHGTPVKTAQAQEAPKISIERTPFIWIVEVLKEEVIHDRASTWGRSSSPKLYFMDAADVHNWTSEEHKQEIIEPIRQMIELFFEKIHDEPGLYEELKRHGESALPDWGHLIKPFGNIKRIFNEYLTGHEVSFDFKMSKTACDPRQSIQSTQCDLAVTVDIVNESQQGANDGTATADDTGGQGIITYLWDDPLAQTSKTAIDLAPGTYTVLVSDSINEECTVLKSGTVEAGEEMSLRFDGVNDYVNVGLSKPPELNLTGAYSISAWINSETITGGRFDAILKDLNETASLSQFGFELNRTAGRLSALANAGNVVITSSTSIIINTWYHVVLTKGGVSGNWDFNIYLNGVNDGSVSGVTINPDPQQGCAIGKNGQLGTGGKFKGRINAPAVFAKELSPSEVLSIYNSGTPNNVLGLSISNLVGYWPFNESGTTDIAPDIADGNDGVLEGFIFTPTSPWEPFT